MQTLTLQQLDGIIDICSDNLSCEMNAIQDKASVQMKRLVFSLWDLSKFSHYTYRVNMGYQERNYETEKEFLSKIGIELIPIPEIGRALSDEEIEELRNK